LGGDLKTPAANRTLETRNPWKINPETRSISLSQSKIQDQAKIRARSRIFSTKNSIVLACRPQTLRRLLDHLVFLVASFLGHVYKDPPDPGPKKPSKPLPIAMSKQIKKRGRKPRSMCFPRWNCRYLHAVFRCIKRPVTRLRNNPLQGRSLACKVQGCYTK